MSNTILLNLNAVFVLLVTQHSVRYIFLFQQMPHLRINQNLCVPVGYWPASKRAILQTCMKYHIKDTQKIAAEKNGPSVSVQSHC